jgi:hypothetical protein
MSQVFVRKASTLAAADRAAVETAARDAMNALEHQARAAEPAASERPSVVQIGRGQIEIAGFATQALVESDWYRPFVRPQPSAEVRRLRIESRLWREPLPQVDPSFAIASDVVGDVHRFVCDRFGLVLDTRSWRGSVFLNHEDLEAYDRSLRVATSLFCLDARSVLVHSCGIKYRGKGFLFAGQSGAGKSTLANLSDRYFVLSDETVLVDLAKDAPVLHGTPFRGLSGQPRYLCDEAPLAAVLLLVQSPRNALSRLAAAEAFRRLGRRAFVPAKAQKARVAALDLVDDAVRSVPAFAMEFTKDARFLELLDQEFFAGAADA